MVIAVSVESVRWERVNLLLSVHATVIDRSALPGRFASAAIASTTDITDLERIEYRLETRNKSIPLIVESRDLQGGAVLRVNVTNAAGRTSIPPGDWVVRPYLDGTRCLACSIDTFETTDLSVASKTFLYDKTRCALVVNMARTNHEERPEIRIRVRNYESKVPFRELHGSIKARALKWAVDRGVIHAPLTLAYRAFRLIRPRASKRILLASQYLTISENLDALLDKLRDRELDKTYEITTTTAWRYRGMTHSLRQWLHLVRLWAWADYVFVDDWTNLLGVIRIDPTTVVTQVWHAGHGFKSVGLARFGMSGSPRLDNPHRYYTYAAVGSEGLRDIYAEDFGIEREATIPTGLARIDRLLDPEHAAAVRADFLIRHPGVEGKRVILVAPTYRGAGSSHAFYPFATLELDRLYDWCGDSTVILFRMHPYVTARRTNRHGRYSSFIASHLADRLIDVTDYPSTNDLLHVADVLVTDYSSVCYEYSYLNKPMLFFAPDAEAYAASRGFHDEFEDIAPGKVVRTIDELLDSVNREDYELWRAVKYRELYCGPADRHNADRLIDQVILRRKAR